MSERLEAVTVCAKLPGKKSYASFLAEVAPHTRPHLDRWLIVTTPDDEETKAVCRKWSIEYVESQEYSVQPPFCKGALINHGLHQLTGDGWLLHLDADIALPVDFSDCLAQARPAAGCIYGCLRLTVSTHESWAAVKRQGLYSRKDGWLVEYNDRCGAYVSGTPAGKQTGYVPIGFFQLWHGSETLAWGATKYYPHRHGNAARTDVQFACLWDRPKRVLLPELVVFHLEAPATRMGTNWDGCVRTFGEYK